MGFHKCIITLLACLLFITHTFSQADQKLTLTPGAFIQQVKQYHPIARQANILVDKAAAELLSAKGGFDPVLTADASRKTFDGKNYYYYNNPELRLATLPGINIKSGIENNGGNFLNPETSAGKTGYLGVEIPLAKGFMIDQRRAILKQAKIFQQQSEQDRLTVLNDLLFAAYTDYWEWAGAFQLYNIYTQFVEVANNRLRLVRIGYANGDRATIDTIEAFAQVQNYQLLQLEALLKFNNATLDLSNYLWQPGDIPLLLPGQYVPDAVQFAVTLTPQPIDDLIEQSANRNPELKSYEFKLKSLEVEKRLKFQSLLPSLNLQANLLSKDYFALKGLDAALLENNYKWGVEFKLPLFLRQERGAYRLAGLKIKETGLQLINKRWQTENKIRSYHNENILLLQQLQTAQNIYNNYYSLLRNEELKFSQGESSLFLINSRETKLLELLEKQVKLRRKYLKSGYAIEWAAGLLR